LSHSNTTTNVHKGLKKATRKQHRIMQIAC
jgi:hypothetical protein